VSVCLSASHPPTHRIAYSHACMHAYRQTDRHRHSALLHTQPSQLIELMNAAPPVKFTARVLSIEKHDPSLPNTPPAEQLYKSELYHSSPPHSRQQQTDMAGVSAYRNVITMLLAGP